MRIASKMRLTSVITSSVSSIAGLNDGELVAAEPRHEIGLARAAGEAGGHRFQKLVADHVAERVVDALEFVDVDIEHRQLPVRRRRGTVRA